VSTVNCLAAGEPEQTFQGLVFVTVGKLVLKSISSVDKPQMIDRIFQCNSV